MKVNKYEDLVGFLEKYYFIFSFIKKTVTINLFSNSWDSIFKLATQTNGQVIGKCFSNEINEQPSLYY